MILLNFPYNFLTEFVISVRSELQYKYNSGDSFKSGGAAEKRAAECGKSVSGAVFLGRGH